MNTDFQVLWVSLGLLGMSAAATGGRPKPAPPQEPIGFVTGGVIGGVRGRSRGRGRRRGTRHLAGNRVHRAGDAEKAEAQWRACKATRSSCRGEKSALLNEKSRAGGKQPSLSAKLDDLSQKVQTAQTAKQDASEVLDGLQGDVLFRTGSAEITPEIAHQIQVLAQAVSKSPS